MTVLKIIDKSIDPHKLTPSPYNARKHSEYAVTQLSNYIQKTGFINPISIDEKGVILAGHKRQLAAIKAGLKTVKCLEVHGLTEVEKRSYVLADNKFTLNSKWDNTKLKVELEALLEVDVDLIEIGFDSKELFKLGVEIEDLDVESTESPNENGKQYTNRIVSPIYEPKNEKPKIDDLYDDIKFNELVKTIDKSNITDKEKRFLKMAASRHIVFKYNKIADFYAHSDKNIQELMEDSALVIIDFNKAIEKGFVVLTDELAKAYTHDNESI